MSITGKNISYKNIILAHSRIIGLITEKKLSLLVRLRFLTDLASAHKF